MNKFIANDSGAVTVDWVVLTAGLVGLGLATMAVVSTGVQDTSGDIQGQLEADGMIVTAFENQPDMDSIAELTMRVFTNEQRAEAYLTTWDYDEATTVGMIAQFNAMTDGQDLTQNPWQAMDDSRKIAMLVADQRGYTY